MIPAPKEAGGWRIVQDPDLPGVYWRYRAFTLEYNHWDDDNGVWAYSWDTDLDDSTLQQTLAERPMWLETLFCNP